MSPWGRWERPAGFAALPGRGGCDCHSRSATRRLVSFSQVSQERISGGGVGSSSWSYKVWVFMPFSFLGMGPPVEGASLQPLREAQGHSQPRAQAVFLASGSPLAIPLSVNK